MLSGLWLALLRYISCWWEGIFNVNSSSIAYLSMMFVSSVNLHSGCRRAVVFPSVCVQVVYVVLVSCLVGSGPASLQLIPRWWYIPFLLFLCQIYFFWDAPCVWFGVNFIPSNYGINWLRNGDLILTCDSQWIWDEPLYLVLDEFHLLLGGGPMIKFSGFTKDAPPCYQ